MLRLPIIFILIILCFNITLPFLRWALGVLLFEMLAGFPPFASDNPFGLYQLILKAKFTYPKHISTAAKAAITGFLTVDRTTRLGCRKGGLQGLKKTALFRDVHWRSVGALQVAPPYVPVVRSEGDAANYDR